MVSDDIFFGICFWGNKKPLRECQHVVPVFSTKNKVSHTHQHFTSYFLLLCFSSIFVRWTFLWWIRPAGGNGPDTSWFLIYPGYQNTPKYLNLISIQNFSSLVSLAGKIILHPVACLLTYGEAPSSHI